MYANHTNLGARVTPAPWVPAAQEMERKGYLPGIPGLPVKYGGTLSQDKARGRKDSPGT